jgi:protein-S-isoprenylcysteine O-methyltransferase Ste14
MWNHVRAVLLLPFMNTMIIPGTLLLVVRDFRLGEGGLIADLTALVLAVPLFAAGLFLAVRAIWLFVNRGRGTLAPWDPARVLIAEDIYRFSRNPMKAGLFLILLGECVLLRSESLAIWTVCFIAVNAIYIRVSEERGLRARFGAAYDDYCRRVPRWIGRSAAEPEVKVKSERSLNSVALQ